MKQAYAILFLLFLGPALLAQTNTDSLWQIWRNTHLPDTARLQILQDMAYSYVNNDPDSAQAVAELELDNARQLKLPKWEARAHNIIGLSYRFKSDFPTAKWHYEQSLALSEAAGDKNNMAAVWGNLGDIYRLQSNFPKAIECLTKCLKLAEATGDRKKAGNVYVSIATIFYEEPGQEQKVQEYLEKARLIFEDLKSEQGQMLVYGNLAAVYLDLGQHEKALDFTQKTLALQEKLGDEHGAASTLFNRATIYGEQGRVREALADFDRVIHTFHAMGDQEGLADAYIGMGNLWVDEKRYATAVSSCEKGLRLARELGSPNLTEVEACNCLYKAYLGQGNYKLALNYLEQMGVAKDSLHLQETAQRLKEMEIEQRSVADSLSLEKERLQVEKTMRKKDRNLSVLLVIGLVILVGALAFWSRMLYFQRRSQQFQARSVELEKQQLLNEIALLRTQVNPHFLFNSLSILSSLVHLDANLSEQFIEQLSRSYRYILEQKEFSLVTLRTELEFIKSYAFLLKIRFEDKFDIEYDIPDDLLDRKKIAPLTLQLLIENAVKHNRMSLKEPLTVRVTVADSETLEVKNRLQPRSTAATSTGVGLQNIKDRYALLTDQSVWAGEANGSFVVRVPLL
jgi:tetratricopeptide (TPR) repeat protein